MCPSRAPRKAHWRLASISTQTPLRGGTRSSSRRPDPIDNFGSRSKAQKSVGLAVSVAYYLLESEGRIIDYLVYDSLMINFDFSEACFFIN